MTGTCAALDDTVDLLPRGLAMIAAGQRAAVLAHPRWTDIAQEPNPALQLAWMVRQGLLTYDELDDLHTFEQEPSDNDRIIEEAFAELGRLNTAACGRVSAPGHANAGREANRRLALSLAGAIAATWYLVTHWPG
ncbi:hypothetical protein [Massilia consociata]|uniref:Uncharacterized protein n=1 Tax=Massilia consociata TaxID=760117 RepID=A0ABV6FG15_9BURK